MGDDRGHLEERSAGGGPWGINLDSQAVYSNQGKLPRWLDKHAKDVAEWLHGARGLDSYKGVVRTINMREFEVYVAALVNLFPGLISIETKTEADTSSLTTSTGQHPSSTVLSHPQDGVKRRFSCRVSKRIYIGRITLPMTSCWEIEAGIAGK